MNANERQRPSLRRRVDNRLLAGVIGGIADWLNAPAIFLRVLFYFALVTWPWFIAAYAGLALLLPARGHDRPGWDNVIGVSRLVALGAGPVVLLGANLSTDELFRHSPDLWAPLTAVWVAAVAVFLTRSYPRGPSDEEARATVLGAVPAFLAAGAIALGVWLAPEVRWERAVAVVPLVAGAYLLLGVMSGNWRWRIAPAVAAAVAAAVIAATGIRLDGGIGDKVITARAAEPAPPPQHVAVGDLRLNLAHLRPSTRTTTIRATVGYGDLDVNLPRNARISVDVKVGRGQLRVADEEEGLGLSAVEPNARVWGAGRPGARYHGPRVRLVAEVGSGSLDVQRGNP